MSTLLLPLLVLGFAFATDAAQSCTEGETRLMADFPGARAEDCTRTETGFAIHIRPEATPINKSPWYAFDIFSETEKALSIDIYYTYGTHRYHPKRFDSLNDWSLFPKADVLVSDDKSLTRIVLTKPEPLTRIAAQPVLSPTDRRAWSEAYAERAGFDIVEAGKSPLGDPILRLSSVPERTNPPHLLLIGGQHPPEVPGVFAMRAFLDRLAENDPLALSFREQVMIDILPTLNPDGIAAGNWRLNSELADLNRDWGPFTQSETKLVSDILEDRQLQGAIPAMMIDFHATYVGDVLYTPTGEEGEKFTVQIDLWAKGIDDRVEGPGFRVDPTSNPGLPTAKTWYTNTFDAPGVTLEIADATPPSRAAALGRAAAESLMSVMLAPSSELDAAERAE